MLFDGQFLFVMMGLLVIYLIVQLKRKNDDDFSLTSFRFVSQWFFDQPAGLVNARTYFEQLIRMTNTLTVCYLHGPEGSGKTTLAEAVAVKFPEAYWITGPQLIARDVRFVQRLLEEIGSSRHCCLVIDLFDFLFDEEKQGQLRSSEHLEALVQTLKQLRGCQVLILLVGRSSIDRFDTRVQAAIGHCFCLTPLDTAQRLRILKRHLRQRWIPEAIFAEDEWDQLGQLLMDMSAHELTRIVASIDFSHQCDRKAGLSLRMAQEAVMAVAYGKGEKRCESEDSRQRIAVHEAGHALVGYILMHDQWGSVCFD